MKIRYVKSILVFSLMTVCFVTSSCSGQNNDQDISNVQVSKTDQYNSNLSNTEEFPLPNCGGSSELAQTLGTQASVKKTVTIGGTATVRGGGEMAISSTVQGKLEAEISAAYSETFQNESFRLDSIQLKAAPASHVVYVIQWVDEQYSSTVSYILEGKTYDTDYVYTLRVPKISNSYPVACPTTPNSNQSSTTESSNWVFTLNYIFPSGFWSEGKHTYTLSAVCGNEQPGSVTHEFNVSQNYALISDNIYLRWGGGLRVGDPWGELIEGINPSQSIIAVVMSDGITKSEADRLESSCTGTISWDGGAEEPMIAQIPFQH